MLCLAMFEISLRLSGLHITFQICIIFSVNDKKRLYLCKLEEVKSNASNVFGLDGVRQKRHLPRGKEKSTKAAVFTIYDTPIMTNNQLSVVKFSFV